MPQLHSQRRRVAVIVLDGLGIGALPDAEKYGDLGSNTLGHLAEAVGGLDLPHLAQCGLGHLGDFQGIPALDRPIASYGRMAEASSGKDTLIGHWEMTGLMTETPFPTYENGFPPEVIRPFEAKIGRKVLGNCVASGTKIIQDLGARHLVSESPIVYTSADSVFQIAAHESVIPPTLLYEICEIARDLLKEPHQVARVIARPFIGEVGHFVRTDRRRDFSLPPTSETLLDRLAQQDIPVVGIGKIDDIFSGRGLSTAIHTRNNDDGMDQTLSVLGQIDTGLIFTNLVDFDMLYGHRNDPIGYTEALKRFDQWLPVFISKMKKGDYLMITADHGNDPLFPGTDHTREYVPLLVYHKGTEIGIDLGDRGSFADLGQTIAEIFQVPPLSAGKSFFALMG